MLDTMRCSDAGFHATADVTRNNDGTELKLRDFKLAAACLLSYRQVEERKLSKDHNDNHASPDDNSATTLST